MAYQEKADWTLMEKLAHEVKSFWYRGEHFERRGKGEDAYFDIDKRSRRRTAEEKELGL